jgi:hypothetical protein
MLWWVCGASNKGSVWQRRASSLYHCEVIICVGVERKSKKRQNEMGGTSRVATYHDKDVLGVEVKRDVP